MECIKCGKDMSPPVGMPMLGLSLGVKYQDFDFSLLPILENFAKYSEYCERQFGEYESSAWGICCECVLNLLKE